MKFRAGYTLVEVGTVVAIIGIVAAIAVPQFAHQARRAREDSLRTTLATVRAALHSFRNDVGLWPGDLGELIQFTSGAGWDSTGTAATYPATSWRGPYLPRVPIDPVSQTALSYTASTGTVRSSATGTDSRGVAFSAY